MHPQRRPALLLFAALVFTSLACEAQPLPFTLKQVAPKVYAVIDNANGDSGANAGIVIGEEAVAIIDSLYKPKATQALLAEVRRLTPLPIRYLINTHYHIDHVAGNAVFAQAGAVIVGHKNMARWINTENLKFFGATPTAEGQTQVAALAPPQIGFDSEMRLNLGQRTLLIKALPGHTGGDAVVSVVDAGVVFAGDLFWRRAIPNLIDAHTADWIRTLDTLRQGQPATAVFVPGHGDVGSAGDVQDFQRYLGDLQAAVKQQLDAGKDGEALQAAALAQLTPSYGGWAYFKNLGPRNVRDMQAELTGNKRRPAP
ncbi:MBL fold metallo-hydrolase [Roseateles toxinivorans]|uniref:Glyoxylase-like metal-dependent hydrolase (Beta-lactamase superfamily II) n=1 Tax=Roseateles toxinivorans TaxID=270368 RepID=A0A4V3CT60_9BURK|nr:MBL fold metallo-hydrolase [Roseateles toxinivorans]TDP63804.1 glyoxylase-like metal-dependent hydrolase (beta-lactamase superfamily II) [Roseateles toxinivorans]